jgi:hypothetical protein
MADDIVKEALDAFQAAQSAESDNRKRALEDIRFARIPGNHWPEEVRKQREIEMRPCLEIDILGPVLRQIVNDARMNRPATTIIPVDSKADIDTAEVLTGMVRSIESSSNADIAYDTSIEAAASGGFGYWRVNVDYANIAMDEDGVTEMGASAFDKSVFIRTVANPFSIYGDPDSTELDGSDWMVAHVVETMGRARFRDKYPGAKETDFDGVLWGGVEAPWRDEKSIQVAEYWKREKVVKKARAIQTQDDVLIVMEDEYLREKALFDQLGGEVIGERPIMTHKVTQHIVNGVEELSKTDWLGSYIPIVPVYGEEVNEEGRRHFFSAVNRAKDSQRNFDYWRSAATEMVALAPRVPFVGPKGAFETDHAKWSTANSSSHAFLEYDGPIAPARQQGPTVPTGMMQEALSAADDVKRITGIHEASLGMASNETSGKAIMARQREGDVSTFHFIDNLTRAIRHSGRIIVDLIPKVYSTPRIVRILGEDGTTEERQLNQAYEDAQGKQRIHDVRTGRYDVAVKAGPSFTSRREEAATQMMELVRVFPDAAPIIGDLLAKNLDWPGADEIAKRLERMLPDGVKDEQGEIPPEVQQQMQQMAEALQVLQQRLAEAEGEKDLKTREMQVKEYEAVTARLQTVMASIDPMLLQQILIELNQDLSATSAVMPETELPSPEAPPPLG